MTNDTKFFEPLTQPRWAEQVLTKEQIAEPCLVEKFFEEERKKPLRERKNYCHISCPCPRCKPGFL